MLKTNLLKIGYWSTEWNAWSFCVPLTVTDFSSLNLAVIWPRCKLALVASHFRVPPIPSHGPLPCEVAKKCHSAGTPVVLFMAGKIYKILSVFVLISCAIRKIEDFFSGPAYSWSRREVCYENNWPQLYREPRSHIWLLGKGPCDGIGGTLKRLATRASLQRPYDSHGLKT